MRIGYACLTLGVRDTDLKTCKKENATDERLLSLINHNLDTLKKILEYNSKNNIKLFRISSDLIPFGSSPVNKLPWWEIFKCKFDELAELIKTSGQRVSMHPGQYTVLNSPKKDVVERAIEDLEYHCKVLDCLKTGTENKIILHIGGVYDNKSEAMNRFVNIYVKLNERIKTRLVIENDDKCYSISDAMEIYSQTGIPVVFDNLHHEINLPGNNIEYTPFEWIAKVNETWKSVDGNQKIHYSQQDKTKKSGSHSNMILVDEFAEFYNNLSEIKPDIMLEVKDKNISALKCVNLFSKERNIGFLEEEWAKYKYSVLEHCANEYQQIRDLLKDKKKYPVMEFYKLIESALNKPLIKNNQYNAAQHVWGYFSEVSDDSEKIKLSRLFNNFYETGNEIRKIKRELEKLALKYNIEYLLNSYYFDVV